MRQLDKAGLGIEPHGFDSEYMEGTRAYLQGIGRNAEEVGGLVGLLTEKVLPLHERYARELGLDDSAFAGLTARTTELRALQGQLGSSLPHGQRGTPVAQAVQVAVEWFGPIRAKTEKGVARGV